MGREREEGVSKEKKARQKASCAAAAAIGALKLTCQISSAIV